ncbi:hypothetical protein VTG60DRAFT_1375 [Thermothelomyces hinnuleus]
MESILADLRPIAKFKARSHETSKNAHLPLLLLQSHLDSRRSRSGPVVVLLGDSMLERMTTTGGYPNLVAPWPSPAMLSDDGLRALSLRERGSRKEGDEEEGRGGEKEDLKRLEGVFNAGVGGDTIQNLAYRLVGTGNENGDGKGNGEDLPGLLPALAAAGTVQLWVVHVGTNNLSPKKGLSDGDADALRRVVAAVSRVHLERGECRVLVTGLFHRRDMSRELVDRANEKIRAVVERLQRECGTERVAYLPSATAVRMEDHLEDHVHLTLEGYQLWMEELFPAVARLLESV